MSEKSICRWGILGTAGIAWKNWLAIRNAENAQLVAVASRTLHGAQSFIEGCQADAPCPELPRPIDHYEELLAAEDIDAVYIPLPTGPRKEWVIRAAEAGKHVLAEKPAGCNAGEVLEILAACKAAGVQYMEGVMFMHSARLEAMRAQLDDPETMGEIKRIATGFSFMAPEDFLAGNIRLNSKLEPLGCLGDLGWYTLRFILWAMHYQMPVKVSGRALTELHREDSPNAVPVEFSGELFFENGKSGTFYSSFITEHQQWAHVSGTRGHLSVRDFVLPFQGEALHFETNTPYFDIQGCDFNMQDRAKTHTVPEASNSDPTAQETNLFRKFSDLVLGGEPDPFWGDITLKTQLVMDACVASAKLNGVLVEM